MTMQMHTSMLPIVSVPCQTCAGQPTVNKTHGNQRAVLVGDFLFARSSYLLAHLEDNEASYVKSLFSFDIFIAFDRRHRDHSTSMDIYCCHVPIADHLHIVCCRSSS